MDSLQGDEPQMNLKAVWPGGGEAIHTPSRSSEFCLKIVKLLSNVGSAGPEEAC